jgi:hypothetical protein
MVVSVPSCATGGVFADSPAIGSTVQHRMHRQAHEIHARNGAVDAHKDNT